MMFTQGDLWHNKFDMDNGHFTAKFKYDFGIQMPSQIYYSTGYYYPYGIDVDVEIFGYKVDEAWYTIKNEHPYLLV